MTKVLAGRFTDTQELLQAKKVDQSSVHRNGKVLSKKAISLKS